MFPRTVGEAGVARGIDETPRGGDQVEAADERRSAPTRRSRPTSRADVLPRRALLPRRSSRRVPTGALGTPPRPRRRRVRRGVSGGARVAGAPRGGVGGERRRDPVPQGGRGDG